MLIIFRPEALQEFDDAADWYEKQKFGLGIEFKLAVYACIDRIIYAPNAHPLLYKTFRKASVRKFDYRVVFKLAEDAITIHAVFHGSRDPKVLRKRLR